MRLSGHGNSFREGRVEIFYDGRWGTVCQNYFDIVEANIVCRQLGFGGATGYRTNSFYGAGSGVVWLQLDWPGCSGEENSITLCSHRTFGTSTCSHNYDVGVMCSVSQGLPCK